MHTARLSMVVKARALSAAVALLLVLGTGIVVPLRVIAQDETAFDVAVESVESLGGLNAVVANSGEGVNLRAEASHDAEILATLAEGTVVTLRIDLLDTVHDADGETRWWPVSADGQDGWVSGFYLAATDVAPAEADDEEADDETVAATEEADEPDEASTAAEDDEAAADLPDDTFAIDVASADELSGLTARVASPDGVNLRAEPSASADVVTTVPGDEIVALRIDEVDTATDDDGNRWWPVRYDGNDGWIVGSYLGDADGAAASSADDTSSSDGDARFAAGDYVAATTDEGEGVNIRDGASLDAETLSTIPESDVVQVMDGPFVDEDGNSWYLVTDGDVTGYSDSEFLTAASAPEVELEPAKFGAGDAATARTPDGVGVNVRAEATTGSDLVGTLLEQTDVEVLDGPFHDASGNDWYQIEGGDLTGYVAGDLMDLRTAAPEPEQPRPSGPTGTFINPLPGAAFTQSYGCTGYAFEPFDAAIGCNFHNGIDLAMPAGTNILAADGGTVTAAGWCDCGLGYYVTVDHGNGFRTTYGHMSAVDATVGEQVNQGDVIGFVGSTGLSTGPHVHFMIEQGGTTVDPLGYVSV